MTKDELIKALQENEAPGDTEVCADTLEGLLGIEHVETEVGEDGKPVLIALGLEEV